MFACMLHACMSMCVAIIVICNNVHTPEIKSHSNHNNKTLRAIFSSFITSALYGKAQPYRIVSLYDCHSPANVLSFKVYRLLCIMCIITYITSTLYISLKVHISHYVT